MICPKKEFCQVKDWYPIFREAYEERPWEEWEQEFCNGHHDKCLFYNNERFFLNPSKRFFQSEKVKKVIRILEGKDKY